MNGIGVMEWWNTGMMDLSLGANSDGILTL